jgi:hypothetical protein
VLWIRIAFNADPDPAILLNLDLDPGSQTNADICGSGFPDSVPGHSLKSPNVKIEIKNIL